MNSLLRFVASQHSTELNAVRVTFKSAELIVMGSLGGIQDKLGAELDARERSHGGLSEAAHYGREMSCVDSSYINYTSPLGDVGTRQKMTGQLLGQTVLWIT